jgi:tetratricopeptide (TPR) repeat protein
MKPVKAEAIAPYNKGVDLLEAKDYAKAREQFDAALKVSEEFPEAHNNLAFALRMLSPDNAEASLSHYKRSLELEPKFAQALYYRGILFVQLDRAADAEKDRAALVATASDESKTYAAELGKIIKAGKATKKQDALSVYGNLAQ